jgi:hypothetical protein
MLTTTTIRLFEELKARVIEAAKRAGTTTHGFMNNGYCINMADFCPMTTKQDSRRAVL